MTAVNKKDAWLQTFCGIKFNVFEPKLEDILIQDIAHALSNISRFGGHCREFTSVAQHCVLVSRLIDNPALPTHELAKLKLAGLLHDATEAYLIDLPSPIKRQMPVYVSIENNLHSLVAKKFDLTMEDFHAIKLYDKVALVMESKALMAPFHPDWEIDDSVLGQVLTCSEDYPGFYKQCWTPKQAEHIYLNTFTELWLNRIH